MTVKWLSFVFVGIMQCMMSRSGSAPCKTSQTDSGLWCLYRLSCDFCRGRRLCFYLKSIPGDWCLPKNIALNVLILTMVHHDLGVWAFHHYSIHLLSSLPVSVPRRLEFHAHLTQFVCMSGVQNIRCHFGALQQLATFLWISLRVGKLNLPAISELNAPMYTCTLDPACLCVCDRDSISMFEFVLMVVEVVMVSVVVVAVAAEEEVVLLQGFVPVSLSVCTVAKSLNDFQHPSPMPIRRWKPAHHGERTLSDWG